MNVDKMESNYVQKLIKLAQNWLKLCKMEWTCTKWNELAQASWDKLAPNETNLPKNGINFQKLESSLHKMESISTK